jgi:hypothetical protein
MHVTLLLLDAMDNFQNHASKPIVIPIHSNPVSERGFRQAMFIAVNTCRAKGEKEKGRKKRLFRETASLLSAILVLIGWANMILSGNLLLLPALCEDHGDSEIHGGSDRACCSVACLPANELRRM